MPAARLDTAYIPLVLLLHSAFRFSSLHVHAGDFATNLKLLQSYPSADVGELLAIANRLRPAALHLGR